MKILVTGGAGYKGVVLTQALLGHGDQVTILDNFMYGCEPVLHLVGNPAFSVVREDIRNISEKHLKDFDVIYHLAGISGYPACEANPHSAKLINVDASRRLRDLLSRDQRLIYASTTSFYGKSGARCDEDTPVEPVSLYGITKYQGEQELLQRENTISLRFATIFGVSPRMRVDLLVNDFTSKAVHERCIVLFESKTKRTFLHIQDAIAAYVFTLDHFDAMKHGIFNVGSETLNFTKMEIANAVKAETGCSIIDSEMKDFDTRDFVIAFDKLAKLGYQVRRSLPDGIREMVKLYRFYRPNIPYATI
jgi:nucleoside-diphosphate-sugar epimerase